MPTPARHLALLALALLAPTTRAQLTWDAITRDYAARPGESSKPFTFEVSNATAAAIVVTAIAPACGCTVVKAPTLPWTLAPGDHGRIEAAMDWAGRFGEFTKTIFVETSAGPQTLTLKIQIPQPEGLREIPFARARNLQAAMADRQAVFRNACARCHAAPATGLAGEKLYIATCGICHEAEHRASMVPELKTFARPFDAASWRQAIAHGKPGSLMPAFAQTEGGPLDAAQIESLVAYLVALSKTP